MKVIGNNLSKIGNRISIIESLHLRLSVISTVRYTTYTKWKKHVYAYCLAYYSSYFFLRIQLHRKFLKIHTYMIYLNHLKYLCLFAMSK